MIQIVLKVSHSCNRNHVEMYQEGIAVAIAIAIANANRVKVLSQHSGNRNYVEALQLQTRSNQKVTQSQSKLNREVSRIVSRYRSPNHNRNRVEASQSKSQSNQVEASQLGNLMEMAVADEK